MDFTISIFILIIFIASSLLLFLFLDLFVNYIMNKPNDDMLDHITLDGGRSQW